MKISGVRFITTTAMLLALTIVFQMLRVIFPFLSAVPIIPGFLSLDILLVGSLVNLCLIVAAATAGVWSGIIISVVAPVIALLQGHMPLPWLLPFVMIGNALIVVFYWLFMKKSEILGFVTGAVVKTAFLWIGIILIGMHLFQTPEKVAAAISVAYSWPQLITGIIGGFISIPIVHALKPGFEKKA
jgi:hypothetical protein